MQAQQRVERQHGGLLLDEDAPLAVREQLALVARRRITELDLHEEAVELRLRQRKRADLVRRIARCDDEERCRQRVGRAVGRHLAFLHRFEQRALRLRRRAVDLVGEDELREHGTLVELEAAAVAMEHRDAEHVGRQQVARELNALIAQAERLRERVRERRLADARHVLDEQVAAREQAGERQLQLPALADDDALERVEHGPDQRLAVGAAAQSRSM